MDTNIAWTPADDEDYLAVRQTAIEGDVKRLAANLKPGVDITALYGDEFEGRTVLHDAAPKGHVDVIRYLLAHGEPDDGHDETQYGISTPLFYALRSAQIDAVRTLLNVGPNINIVGPNGDNVLSVVLQGGRVCR